MRRKAVSDSSHWLQLTLLNMPNLVHAMIYLLTVGSSLLLGDRTLRLVGLVLGLELMLVTLVPNFGLDTHVTIAVALDLINLLLFSWVLLSTRRTWPIFSFAFAFASLSFTGMQWMQALASVWENGTEHRAPMTLPGESIAFFGAMQMFWWFAMFCAILSGVAGEVRRRGWRASLPSIALPDRLRPSASARLARAPEGSR